MHNIQYTILDQLMSSETKRFSELRPKRVDSNLFQYHLKAVIKDGYVEKAAGGYRLSPQGMYYADRHSSALKAERLQPKIITIVVVKNTAGQVLLRQKLNQPFIGSYHLPAGKIHEQEPIAAAASRELREKTGLSLDGLKFRTSVHVRIHKDEQLVSEYFGYVLAVYFDGDVPNCEWYDPVLAEPFLSLAPSVKEVIDAEARGDKSFHEIEVAL